MNPGDITIDPEFQNLIRPLSADERKELKESLSSAGLLMPLILWRKDGKNILVDGHNRLSLWKEFDGFNEDFEFKTQELYFGNRDNVKEWIIKNQLGRRNLSPTDFNLLLGQLYNQKKKARGGDRKSKDQIDTLNTAEKLAAEHGVSAAKVKRAGRLAAKVDEIKQAEPELPREEVIKKATAAVKIYKHFSHTTPFSLAENDQELAEIMRLKYPKACSNLETGAEFFDRMVDEVKKYEAWRVIGFASFEDFCREKLGKTLAEVEEIVSRINNNRGAA